jgi:hypothetical protein
MCMLPAIWAIGAWWEPGLLDISCEHLGFTVNFLSQRQEATYSDQPDSHFTISRCQLTIAWEQCGSSVWHWRTVFFSMSCALKPRHMLDPTAVTSLCGVAPWLERRLLFTKDQGSERAGATGTGISTLLFFILSVKANPLNFVCVWVRTYVCIQNH